MVKSLNTEMAHTTKGTWFREGPIYGNIMVGDKAFEFYNDTKLQDYVQIPWDYWIYWARETVTPRLIPMRPSCASRKMP